VGNTRHAHFGVPHGGRVVAVDRTEVALTIHQHVAQREGLCHAHDGVVHRQVAMRVVLTDYITDDTRRFLVRFVPVIAEFVHRKEHAAMYRLEAVTHVRQRSAYDHAHRVIKVGLLEFFFDVDRGDFAGEVCHVPAFLVSLMHPDAERSRGTAPTLFCTPEKPASLAQAPLHPQA
jgi:hypothetical protein